MLDLLEKLRTLDAYRSLVAAIREGCSVAAEGLWGSSAAFLAAGLAADVGRIGVVISPRLEQAEELLEDIGTFAPGTAALFPAWETFDPEEEPDPDTVSRRLLLLRQLADRQRVGSGHTASSQRTSDSGHSACEGTARLLIVPLAAALQWVPAPESLHKHTTAVRRNTALAPEALAAWLVAHRFRHVVQVEVPGEFSRRGGILDVFPFGSPVPYRVEFFGDQVESVRTFDVQTQVSAEEVAACEILAPQVAIDDRGGVLVLDYLPDDAWLLLLEAKEIFERALALGGEVQQGRAAAKRLAAAISRFTTLRVAAVPGAESGKVFSFEVRSVQFLGQGLQTVMADLVALVARTQHVVITCDNEAERNRLQALLAECGTANMKMPGAQPWEGSEKAPPWAAKLEMRIGRVNQGFEWVDLGLALLPHHEIFNRYRLRRTTPRYRHTTAIESLADLQPGDYVVEYNHGIGIFRGLETLEQDGEKQEVLAIEYQGGAILYVPAVRIESVQKYIGPSEHRPPLSMLGTTAWRERRERARQAAETLAAELLATQAARQTQEGFAFPPDSEWQHEFEAAFIYPETEDQLTVAEEIRRDMQSPRPMDRLVCGDVGYGKTELAMRAAFRCVMAGKQVAVLVPTTILAAQHYRTFTERMADYPIHIEMLCRFLTPAEQQRVLEDLATGRVDICIGTHRLLQRDVVFRDLGLAIIDEEQRFGVRHKEHFKRLRRTVDVLTLTATPIPRTLHMSLLGLRDISSLTTPPRDRLAIHTRVWRFNRDKIRQAILHELAREGQVFVVHPRVHDIEKLANFIRAAVPEARVTVAHGQMPERLLEERMQQFLRREYDVLVCTNIIESGLDIPNVNTIIINRADHFGLADLHQLRGRVGRYKHRAYAYLMIPAEGPVSPKAEKRLKAIEEYAELGAGFRIALRDLEIRGAGNILGPEQHGHLVAVGYDLYCRLLAEAVRRVRREPLPEISEVTVALGLSSYFPATYVPDARHRLELYRRLSRATTENELNLLLDEVRDRFGQVPQEAENLFLETRLRLCARIAGIRGIYRDKGAILVRPADLARLRPILEHATQIGQWECRHIDDKTIHLILNGGARSPREVAQALLSLIAGLTGVPTAVGGSSV